MPEGASGLFSCDICAHYHRAWSETGREDLIQRCAKENEDGVKQVNTVSQEGECPYASRLYYQEDDDVYPKREIRDSPDQEPWLTTHAEYNPNVNPHRRIPKKPKRLVDRF